MENDMPFAAILAAMTGGMLIGMLITIPSIRPMQEELDNNRKLVTECEANKPRNISCILTAVEKK
jgi:Na+/H+ antiporter NhaC